MALFMGRMTPHFSHVTWPPQHQLLNWYLLICRDLTMSVFRMWSGFVTIHASVSLFLSESMSLWVFCHTRINPAFTAGLTCTWHLMAPGYQGLYFIMSSESSTTHWVTKMWSPFWPNPEIAYLCLFNAQDIAFLYVLLSYYGGAKRNNHMVCTDVLLQTL